MGVDLLPRGHVNDYYWRNGHRGGVDVPYEIYIAQRLDRRHDLEIESVNVEQGTVTIIRNREYMAAIGGE